MMATWGADARYTRLIEEHGRRLFRLALLLTGNPHDAEDAVQDALIAVASTWPTVRPATSVAYLKRAVASRAIDVIRRRRETSVSDVPDRSFEDFAFLRFEEDQRFFALVSKLPDRQRATLILKFHADLDDHAIAKTLGISVATVRSQAHHGLTKLRAVEVTKTEGTLS